MIDIEALGKMPYGIITNVGLTKFSLSDPDFAKQTTTFNVCAYSCEQEGLTMDVDTVAWWLRQSKEAQQELDPENAPFDIRAALHHVGDLCKNTLVIGQPAYYDLVGLNQISEKIFGEGIFKWSQMVDARNLMIGWQHHTYADVRQIYQREKKRAAVAHGNRGVKHNAGFDSLVQATALANTFQAINPATAQKEKDD